MIVQNPMHQLIVLIDPDFYMHVLYMQHSSYFLALQGLLYPDEISRWQASVRLMLHFLLETMGLCW